MIWHPASSAPKDGSWILVWDRGWDCPIVVRYNGLWQSWDDGDGWERDEFLCWAPITKPEEAS